MWLIPREQESVQVVSVSLTPQHSAAWTDRSPRFHCTKYQAKLTHSGNSMLVFGFGL